MNNETIDVFRQQLFTLARTLKIDPLVPENQVSDRVALSFRKLLNFLAQHGEISLAGLLAYPAAAEAQATLAEIMQENLADAQQGGVFRQDIPVILLGKFFTGMLLQLAQTPAEPALRHQQSLAATRLFCEGAGLQPD
ncbi:hypothetical protein [Serratia sp. M24T3]|uniref:hypothetical protein n=1 Tax=Serratia sp. M24T3 TaxID=932213 RepID=UPI00025BAABB|nr:hypothetical protein [Serratia sp. M24T3]EIC85296.1 hypothetical protein SPM24T3_07654 [Serratia sp. M24T3]